MKTHYPVLSRYSRQLKPWRECGKEILLGVVALTIEHEKMMFNLEFTQRLDESGVRAFEVQGVRIRLDYMCMEG